jgi:soluble lytic murein transglycosylase-like protein
MAVESSFNPFAQSPVGAQGLMQVMTSVHDDKYEAFGGRHAAFDPVSNLRVGVQVLKECIARAGSLQEGLKHYVGAALIETDGGYVGKVLAEQGHLQRVAQGMKVPFNAPIVAPREATPATPGDEAPAAQVALLR